MNPHRHELVIESREGYLNAVAIGVRTRENVAAITARIFDSLDDRGLDCVLVDVRGLKGRLGVSDSLQLATEVFPLFRGKGLRKAAVVSGRARPARGWFLETVSRNRGFNFRVFASVDDAVEWLLE